MTEISTLEEAFSLLTTAWQQEQLKSNIFPAEGQTSKRHLIQTEIKSGVTEAVENESLIVSTPKRELIKWLPFRTEPRHQVFVSTRVSRTASKPRSGFCGVPSADTMPHLFPITSVACAMEGRPLWIAFFLHAAKHRGKWRALYTQFITEILPEWKKKTGVFEFEGTEEERTLSWGEAKPPSTTRAKQTEGLEAEEGWDKDGEIISFFIYLFILKRNNSQGFLKANRENAGAEIKSDLKTCVWRTDGSSRGRTEAAGGCL